jgi:hypothetical protein
MNDEVKAGDPAVVIRGLEQNLGRIVFVEKAVAPMDFSELGFGVLPGWLIRSLSDEPLETIGGPRMTGYTPVGTLRRVPPLPPKQMQAIDRRLTQARIREALNDLAAILEAQEVCERLAKEAVERAAQPG